MTTDECAKCGRGRSSHTGILNECPGREYSYYVKKYGYDGELDCERTSEPVCPHCGERDGEWWDSGVKPDETERVMCHHCEKDYDCECIVDYSFTTTIPDLVAEAYEEARRRVRYQEYDFDRLMAADDFAVGDRVRDDNKRLGRVEAIDDRGWVTVAYDQGHKTDRSPQSLEVIS